MRTAGRLVCLFALGGGTLAALAAAAAPVTGPAALGFAALRSGGLGLPGLLSRRRLLGLLGRAGLAALLAAFLLLAGLGRFAALALALLGRTGLGGLSAAAAALTAHGLAAQVTQIAVSRTRPAGGLHLLMANNPVFLVTGNCE